MAGVAGEQGRAGDGPIRAGATRYTRVPPSAIPASRARPRALRFVTAEFVSMRCDLLVQR
jgi:hypothetical protein